MHALGEIAVTAAHAGTNPLLNSLRSCTVRSTMGTAKTRASVKKGSPGREMRSPKRRLTE